MIHAWDLATATGQDSMIDDDPAAWTLATVRPVVPEDRSGPGFNEAIPVGAEASPLDQLIGFSGRQP